MNDRRSKVFAIAVALVGIAIELIAIVLLARKSIGSAVAVPMIITGMFLAFVPVFFVARRFRR
ncbi:MAG TPA: hypothetical protein VF911_02915 [Thermoanaerobaculia bacterium]|jgi:hypothetical protein